MSLSKGENSHFIEGEILLWERSDSTTCGTCKVGFPRGRLEYNFLWGIFCSRGSEGGDLTLEQGFQGKFD